MGKSKWTEAQIVAMLRAHFPGQPAWAAAFVLCTRHWDRGDLYTYFLCPAARRTRWNYAGGFFLDDATWGTLTVDLIHAPQSPGGIAIGGIEFLDIVMGYRTSTGAIREKFHRPSS